MMQINLFRHSFDTTPLRTLTVSEALDALRTGAYRQQVERLLPLYAQGDEDAYRKAKATLPAFTFGGTFAPSRAIKHLVQHSGIVHGDLDHLPDVGATKQALCQDPHVLYCFRSPSGEGLKLGVRIAPVADDAAYKHAWGVVAAEHLVHYGVTWDPSGKDVSRLCYMSYDPDCYVNLQADVYAVPPPMITPAPTPRPAPRVQPLPQDARARHAQRALTIAVGMIEDAPEHHQHHARLRAARLLGGYVAGGLLTYAEAYAALETPTEAQAKNMRAAMKTIKDGLTYGQAAPITPEDLGAEWEQWKASHLLRPRSERPLQGTRTITTPLTGRSYTTAPLTGRQCPSFTLGEPRL